MSTTYEVSEREHGKIRSLLKPLAAVWWCICHPKQVYSNIVYALKTVRSLLAVGIVWMCREIAYWFHLFLYTSRQFLRVEAYLSILGAFAFFGVILMQDMSTSPRMMLEYCYIYFTVVMVLLSMNLLPRERERDTLEILWSQPMTRGKLIVMQLITLTIWIFMLCLFVVVFFRLFAAYYEGLWITMLLVITSSFAVGVITVLISTFCRHAIATGLVSLLVFGIHFFWLRELGPIVMYHNPISDYQAWDQNISPFGILFNRLFLFVLVGFVLDYLFRRLRQTARWFT